MIDLFFFFILIKGVSGLELVILENRLTDYPSENAFISGAPALQHGGCDCSSSLLDSSLAFRGIRLTE